MLVRLGGEGNFPYRVKGPSTPQAPVTDNDLCTQCEYCVDVCPTHAISLADEGMYSDPNLCIKCCACVKECPEGARTFDTPYTAMLHKNFSARREPEISSNGGPGIRYIVRESVKRQSSFGAFSFFVPLFGSLISNNTVFV